MTCPVSSPILWQPNPFLVTNFVTTRIFWLVNLMAMKSEQIRFQLPYIKQLKHVNGHYPLIATNNKNPFTLDFSCLINGGLISTIDLVTKCACV